MKNIKNSLELIGNTPLLQLSENLFAKLESYNPGGSIKDRPALAMIEAAEKEGLLQTGGTIVEATSGNVGIALAWIGAVRGYKVIIVMPESMSLERRKLIAHFGAELVLTSASAGIPGAVKKAEEIATTAKNCWQPKQFENRANSEVHRKITATEIWEQTGGKLDIFVAGVGTGGTIMGVGQTLKACNSMIKIVAVEPSESPVLSGGLIGPHKIQGIGAGFVPEILDLKILDEIVQVSSEDAIKRARELPKEFGISVGISSGAAYHAVLDLASRKENKNKKIVTVFPDGAERYMSTALFE